MKKAAKIVAIVSLVLDYMILIGLIAFALYLFLNINVIVNNNVSNAMAASSSSSAMASSSMSSDGTEAVGKAIGGAVGRNPIGIIIPCHRVIGADGSLTGYGGGLERKRWMLEMENKELR